MVSVTVKTNTKPIVDLRSKLSSVNSANKHPAFVAMGNQWGRRMSAFTSRRYTQFSRGGGDWPPLSASTVKARTRSATAQAFNKRVKKIDGVEGMKNKAGFRRVAQAKARDTNRGGGIVATASRAAILINTGTLRAATNIGAPGNVMAQIPGGVRFGIGGPVRARKLVKLIAVDASGKKKRTVGSFSTTPTLGQLAQWHQNGAGNNPVRKIVVAPDAQTVAGMSADMNLACRAIIKESGAGK